jgi:molybdate transport system substrate-binding protein
MADAGRSNELLFGTVFRLHSPAIVLTYLETYVTSKLWYLIAIGALAVFGQQVTAAEVHVIVSGGAAAAFKQLVPAFEQRTLHHVVTEFGSSMGTSPASIPMRLDRGERVDVVIMVRDGLQPLIDKKQLIPGSAMDIAHSKIAMAVRTGAPVPNIGTVDAFRNALLQAKSVAYSDSASGVYISGELYRRLGIEQQMAGRSHTIPGTPVGDVVASGEYEIGFQQYSELLPISGIQIVGLIPAEVQKITAYTAALTSNARATIAGRELIRFLLSPQAAQALKDSGLEPVGASTRHQRARDSCVWCDAATTVGK